MSIHAPDYVRRIAPYQAGKPISELAREYGLDEAGIVKLASNENPLGMPESARRALVDAFGELAQDHCVRVEEADGVVPRQGAHVFNASLGEGV